ncbi:AbrB/MazE/SpoVT family DNA-binding domain-containing protein (plasmid) [Rossellomorea sp. AcN35-11]|nr:AbrB/MazE/SpoVT family DNA-binding domain-containing protein [Rossellomorea aquimaris]WJV31788.1 AbrB/MazE/SpoVT family DNA-binding domain-containing protein [Rossellomorea sp. AcN35-11]
MSNVTVLSKGQITIPKDVRTALSLGVGDTLIYQPSKIHRDSIITKSKIGNDVLDIHSTLTQKGQTTIPRTVREDLDLNPGDTIVFRSLNDNIHFRKQGELLSCPACEGKGGFEKHNLPCFLCDQTSYIEETERGILFQLLFESKLRKYEVRMTILHQELGEYGTWRYTDFPKLILESSNYPVEIMYKVQDTLQLLAIKEAGPGSHPALRAIRDGNEEVEIKFLDLFKTDAAKEEAKFWVNSVK